MTPEEQNRIVQDALKSLPFKPPVELTEGEQILARFFELVSNVRDEMKTQYEKDGRIITDRKEFATKAGHLLLDRLMHWKHEELMFVLITVQGWAITQEF